MEQKAFTLIESLAASSPILESNTAYLSRLHPPTSPVLPPIEHLDHKARNQ